MRLHLLEFHQFSQMCLRLGHNSKGRSPADDGDVCFLRTIHFGRGHLSSSYFKLSHSLIHLFLSLSHILWHPCKDITYHDSTFIMLIACCDEDGSCIAWNCSWRDPSLRNLVS